MILMPDVETINNTFRLLSLDVLCKAYNTYSGQHYMSSDAIGPYPHSTDGCHNGLHAPRLRHFDRPDVLFCISNGTVSMHFLTLALIWTPLMYR